ncbi:hypothetical protein L1D34_07315 [Vibrio mediterranei]|uniref:hypothetical protein n=1 Tax=Vibrio mediterranei TaxID=689 RepID=UPI001EFC4DEF|nr:hypothetical protein [Vibrio mediterranei]MCG9624648.1 hypothetical protein [Vibrio mediterranei]
MSDIYGFDFTTGTGKVFRLDVGSPDIYLGTFTAGTGQKTLTKSFPELIGKVHEIYAIFSPGSGFNFNARFSQSYNASTATITVSSSYVHSANIFYWELFARVSA